VGQLDRKPMRQFARYIFYQSRGPHEIKRKTGKPLKSSEFAAIRPLALEPAAGINRVTLLYCNGGELAARCLILHIQGGGFVQPGGKGIFSLWNLKQQYEPAALDEMTVANLWTEINVALPVSPALARFDIICVLYNFCVISGL
jgi:hypothetical protein